MADDFAARFREEDDHRNGHDAHQRQQKPKDGMPSGILRQKTPNDGANGWREHRCGSRPGHIGSTLSGHRDIRGHDVGESDRPTATRPLEATQYHQRGIIVLNTESDVGSHVKDEKYDVGWPSSGSIG